ncbi:1-aminocyclopropane-1-carboxylate deaminase [Francisella frigiditurris]|uniref:Pyridoxal-phosphate dependent enzyme family protein n=1 Tax=Francisella frigiditurris TaxID=1542390 RepID=A0A1J0KT99_9GAMM|nr:1-aminocyclopropane-1-carboxylate deaminase [Francisella frigiditurris]APC96915.1 pyridoxal-phosphate dependent enzyme family protein [Francisella frigiditurris]
MSSQIFQKITFDNKPFIIMRDDLSHPILSGNKARKLGYILKNPNHFSHIKTIVSFGGNQSNFMLALSQLAKLKKWEFHYWIKPLPKLLKQQKLGNIKSALNNGMQLFETQEELSLHSIKHLYKDSAYNSLYFFDQGGRQKEAEEGIKDCANEIFKYCQNNNIIDYTVVVASGTGTTALFLEKYLPNKVYTISCIGDDDYLKQQMLSIDNEINFPKILPKHFKSNFGSLDFENYKIYKSLLKQTNIEFDLLYDPIAWRVLLENYNNLPKPVFYIHCGGVSGNLSMIKRYEKQFT